MLNGVMREFGTDNGLLFVDKPEAVVPLVTTLGASQLQQESENAKRFIQRYDWELIIADFEALLTSLV